MPNGTVTFWLHRPDPSHSAFGCCSCKQDTKERYWGQHFCQMGKNILVRPTRPLKGDHLQRLSQIFRSDRTSNGPFHLTYHPKFLEFWVWGGGGESQVVPLCLQLFKYSALEAEAKDENNIKVSLR